MNRKEPSQSIRVTDRTIQRMMDIQQAARRKTGRKPTYGEILEKLTDVQDGLDPMAFGNPIPKELLDLADALERGCAKAGRDPVMDHCLNLLAALLKMPRTSLEKAALAGVTARRNHRKAPPGK